MCIALTKKKNKTIVTLSRLIRRFTMVKSLKPLALVCYGTIIGSCLMVGTTIAATQNKTSGESRSLASALNPLGIVKTARRLVSSGVQMFRDKLNVDTNPKDSQIPEEKVDEGFAQIGAKVMQSSFFRMAQEDLLGVPRDGVLGGIFRFMGMDSSSIGMVVLNVLIFFAEMITSNMLGKDAKGAAADTRMIKDNLMEWLIKGENEKVDQVLRDARDSALPESIITSLQTKTGNKTACIQLLICKMSPFIWGFQRTLINQLNSTTNNGTGKYDARTLIDLNIWDNLFQVFPDKKKFVSFGDNCESRFPNCKLLKFSNKNSSKNR